MAIEVRGPQLECVRLSRPPVLGSVVHANGKVAILAVSKEAAQNQTPPVLLVSFDRATNRFEISQYDGNIVLGLGVDVVIEPDLSIPSERGTPGPASSSECYYNGGAFFVRLHVPAAPDQHPILNLGTGTISSEEVSQAYVFKRWRLGVRHDGRVTWVLAVDATLCAWASDMI